MQERALAAVQEAVTAMLGTSVPVDQVQQPASLVPACPLTQK